MKKVIYSVSRYRKGDIEKHTGIGYITDRDLVIACTSKNGKPYIRVFENCLERCLPVATRSDEFKGIYDEIREIEVEIKNAYEKREIELTYNIWYKLAD